MYVSYYHEVVATEHKGIIEVIRILDRLGSMLLSPDAKYFVALFISMIKHLVEELNKGSVYFVS